MNILLKISILFLIITCAASYTERIPVGVILKKDEYKVIDTVINYVSWNQRTTDGESQFVIDIIKDIVEEEDGVHYQQSICRLLKQGITILLAPSTCSVCFSVLATTSNEFKIPLIIQELPEFPSDVSPKYAVGIRPGTTRAILDLVRYYHWQDIVYIYDHDYGPENLHFMYALGYRSLKFQLIGILRVSSSEDANKYLRKLDTAEKHRLIRVILDTETALARDILLRHVHDVHVRKKNFHFILSKPTLEEFWISQRAELGALNVTGFLAVHPKQSEVKNFEEAWTHQLSNLANTSLNMNVSAYYYHDSVRVLLKSLASIAKSRRFQRFMKGEPRDCLQIPPTPLSGGEALAGFLKRETISDGVTGKIEFDDTEELIKGQRKNFSMIIVESTISGYRIIGSWTGRRVFWSSVNPNLPTALPQVNEKQKLRITTRITREVIFNPLGYETFILASVHLELCMSPPFMMYKTEENATGNDQFEGYCKDLIDMLAKELDFEYELKLVPDGQYGSYEESDGRWNGMIGELIQGKADLAVADLIITGQREHVVKFTDPFIMAAFSLIMKNPHAVTSSSAYFILNAFSANVWICIFAAFILFILLFHGITKFTGAPDSIESASGIWGRKLTIIANVWFTVGSSVMQDTGVYPRSISSRILSIAWWIFTFTLACLFIVSLTSQLREDGTDETNSPKLSQLRALSLESIISESVSNGWPKIGIVSPSNIENFLKKSTLPIYKQYKEYLASNPDVRVSTISEGIKRVRESKGNYIFMLESLPSEYAFGRQPCDIVVVHDSAFYAGYGIALPYTSQLKSSIDTALDSIQNKGLLGHLYRKWWIDSSECKNGKIQAVPHDTIRSFSGLLCMTVSGFLIILIVFGIQYTRRSQKREVRRQQLSFEDMNLDRTLPMPPPELLAEAPPVLNLPEVEKRTLL